MKSIFDRYRRATIQGLVSVLMCFVMAFAVVPMTGCSMSKTQLKSYGDTIDTAVASILTLTHNSQIAAQVKQAQQVFDNAVQNWSGASTSSMVISSLNAVEAALALIPQTAAYAPLVDVVIAAAESIIASLPVNNTSAIVKANHQVRATNTPLFKSPKQFVAAWNAVVAAHPDLHVAPLVVQK